MVEEALWTFSLNIAVFETIFLKLRNTLPKHKTPYFSETGSLIIATILHLIGLMALLLKG